MTNLRSFLALILLAALPACGNLNYDSLPKDGKFTGSLFVMWVRDNESGSGDGKFVFVPNPARPLTFIRDTRTNPGATLPVIVPGMMYTDGGSIPRPVQFFRGFSPWGYAPAYMVHDWLFVARHCLTDGTAMGDEFKVADTTFRESAEVIGEAIKALIAAERVQRNDVAPAVISGAVAGPIAEARWRARGACAGDRVTPEHMAEAQAGIPGSARARRGTLMQTLPDGRRVAITPGRFVAEVSFD